MAGAKTTIVRRWSRSPGDGLGGGNRLVASEGRVPLLMQSARHGGRVNVVRRFFVSPESPPVIYSRYVLRRFACWGGSSGPPAASPPKTWFPTRW